MLQANHVLQKLKTTHLKMFQISPYCYFFLAQQDIKFPPLRNRQPEKHDDRGCYDNEARAAIFEYV